jgi:hypothetical protein
MGFKVHGFMGFKVQGSRFKVQGSRFKVRRWEPRTLNVEAEPMNR